MFEYRVGVRDVRSCETTVAALCREFNPDSIPLPDASEVYGAVARMEKILAGACNLHARAPADAGARIMGALGPIIDKLFADARREGRRESNEAYGFDALVQLADGCRHEASGGTRPAPKYLGLLRVDLEALVRGGADDEEQCEIDHRKPWAETHETRLDQLDRLCRHDHRLKTHHGWALVDGVGKRDFVPPDDPRNPENRVCSGVDPPDAGSRSVVGEEEVSHAVA